VARRLGLARCHGLRVHDPNDTGYDARGPYAPDDVAACLAEGGHVEGMVALGLYPIVTLEKQLLNMIGNLV
jgi:hypothetical protein